MPTLLTTSSSALRPSSGLGGDSGIAVAVAAPVASNIKKHASPNQPSITLNFQGVDFCLQPSDRNGEVSYKTCCPTNSKDDGNNNKEEGVIIVSLRSFTGTLVVSQSPDGGKVLIRPVSATPQDVPTTASSTTRHRGSGIATTVVEEPNSPDIATGSAKTSNSNNSKGPKKVSPGQQKLPFGKASAKEKKKVAAAANRQSKTQQQPTTKSVVSNHNKHHHDARKKRSQSFINNSEEGPDDDNDDMATADTPKMSSSTKRTRLGDISNNKTYSLDTTTTAEGETGSGDLIKAVAAAGEDAGAAKNDDVDLMVPCQQPTQEEEDNNELLGHDYLSSVPDFSQTMDSGSTNNTAAAAMTMTSSESDTVVVDDAVVENLHSDSDNKGKRNNVAKSSIKETSVQDILDRVNSSGDSVASTKKDEVEDEDVATHMETEDDRFTQTEETDVVEGATKNDTAQIVEDDMVATTAAAITTTSVSRAHGPPCARWGATMCQIHDDQILVYGGQSYDLEGNACIMEDVHIYDPKTSTWEKPINSRGEKRQWHSSVYIPSRKQIIAFGGETVDPVSAAKGKEKIVISDTLRVLDTDIMLWYPPAATGDVPTGRSGHSSAFFPDSNEMVLFGGVRGSKWLNAVSILNIASWVWTTPKVEGMPPKPRSFHSATVVGNKMVIFGGNNKTSCFNTVHVLESIRRRTGDESPSRGNKVCEWKWSHPSVKGKAPFPRTGHSATLLEDGKTICIYGGWDPNEEDEMSGEENIFKSSYLLDTEEWTWKEGPKAQPMGSGTASHEVQDCGPKRSGHQAVLSSVSGEVLVFGGRIPGEALAGDMQKLCPSV